MTTTAQGYTVFWNSIVLYIVYVMDVISPFTTYCACVVVAFSNNVLELAVKCLWILPVSASPLRRLFTNGIRFVTSKRTIFIRVSSGTRITTNKFFTAIRASRAYSLLPRFVVAVSRAVNALGVAEIGKKGFVTKQANSFCFSSLPQMGFITTISGLRLTGMRTKFSGEYAANVYIKNFSALLTSFFNHLSTLKVLPV